MKLYELTDEYRAAVAQLQELDLPPEAVMGTIEAMQGGLEDKLRAIIAVSMELEAEEQALRAHAQRMLGRAEARGKRAENLRLYAQTAIMATGVLGPVKCGEFEAKLQANPLSCDITDEAALAPTFKTAEITVTLPGDGQAVRQLIEGALSAANIRAAVKGATKPDKRTVLAALKEIEAANKAKPAGAAPDRLPGAVMNPRSYRLVVR